MAPAFWAGCCSLLPGGRATSDGDGRPKTSCALPARCMAAAMPHCPAPRTPRALEQADEKVRRVTPLPRCVAAKMLLAAGGGGRRLLRVDRVQIRCRRTALAALAHR